MNLFTLRPLDVAVAAAYVLGLVALALVSRLKITTLRQQFLAAGQARWPVIGFTLYAATLSSSALIGVTGSAYAHGISVYNYDWVAVLVLTLFCAVVLPTYLSSGVFTVPEFLEKRYGRFARSYVSGLSILLMTFVDTAGLLFAGSLLFRLLFPALSLFEVGAALSLCAGLFLVAGGLRAVLITDTVQAVFLIAVCAALSLLALDAVGGWDTVALHGDALRMKLIRPASDEVLPWTGLVTGLPLIGFYFWCTNQYMVQKVLAAKSLDHGRWGSLFAGALKLTTLGLLVIPGLCAPLLFPALDAPDQAFFALAFDLLPTGLIGLVAGVFLVTILSSLAANYNAAATLVTLDFLKVHRPQTSEARLLIAGRMAIVAVMTLSILWLPMLSAIEDTLWNYLQAMLAYFVPPVATLFLIGLFWRRANAFGAACALIMGTGLSLFLFVSVEMLHLFALHFLVSAFLIFGLSGLSLLAGSLMRPAPDASVTALVFSRAVWDRESEKLKGVAWYRNYRWLSVGLLLITACVVAPFL
ncbi:MAG: sodium/solute symporter [Asticcacaulis sp.]